VAVKSVGGDHRERARERDHAGDRPACPFILLEPLRKIRDLDYDHQRHDCTAVSGLWEPFPRRPYATVGWGDAQVRSAMVRTSAERRDSLA
jgi:hypothetical protein